MNETIDPYSTVADDNPKVAAMCCGRSFARLVFHLAQKTLAECRYQFVEENYEPSDASQIDLADRALHAIYAQCFKVGGEDSDACKTIRVGVDRPNAFSCADPEKIARLWEELEHDEEADRDALRRDIVELAISPLRNQLREALCRAFAAQINWFELGRKLEEGLSRPDIYLFQRPFLGWRYPILCTDRYSKSQCEHLTTIRDFDLAASAGATTATGPSVIHVVREPGDVAPCATWWFEVARRWELTGLSSAHLAGLERIRAQYRSDKPSIFRKRLTEYVEELFCTARSSAIGAPRIDLEQNIVEFEGHVIPCIRSVTHLLYELQQGGGRGSFAAARRKNPEIFEGYHKLTDLRKEMDERISNLIYSHRGRPVALRTKGEKSPSS